MKRGIKRLFHANKVRVITYLLVVIFFAISLFICSLSKSTPTIITSEPISSLINNLFKLFIESS